MEPQMTLNGQGDLEKEKFLPDFKSYYKAIVIKAVCISIKTNTQISGTEWKAQK